MSVSIDITINGLVVVIFGHIQSEVLWPDTTTLDRSKYVFMFCCILIILGNWHFKAKLLTSSLSRVLFRFPFFLLFLSLSDHRS